MWSLTLKALTSESVIHTFKGKDRVLWRLRLEVEKAL